MFHSMRIIELLLDYISARNKMQLGSMAKIGIELKNVYGFDIIEKLKKKG